MKKLILSLFLFAAAGFAQTNNPTCQISFGPWTDTNASSVYYNAANTQCAYWVMTYQVTGFSAVSIEFDSAVGTNSGPGAFGLFSGTVVSGTNPSTSVACATVSNCTLVVSGVVGWYKIAFTSHTGSGSIQGTLQGYKTYQALGGNTPTGSGCAGTAATPCIVAGPDAAGAAATKDPVLVAGLDMGGDVRRIATDGNGQVAPASSSVANADGASNTQVFPDDGFANPLYYRTMPTTFNGSTWDRSFACPNQAAITIAAGTDTVIVAGTAAKKTIICHLDFVADSAQTFTIRQGTGSTCGTGTATVAGAYPAVVTFVMDYQPTAALRTTVAANDLCLHSGGAVTVGGFVTYAQF